jgi:anthranilate phosphoribosyltransferase
VWHRSLVERVASALSLLGIDKAWVVHGADGLDEITITNKTFVAACSANRSVKTFTTSPQDFGLEAQSLNGFIVSGPKENAQLIRLIFQGKKNRAIAAARDLVIINAAAALHVAGFTDDLCEAAMFARESIDSGRAASKLDALIRETNRE